MPRMTRPPMSKRQFRPDAGPNNTLRLPLRNRFEYSQFNGGWVCRVENNDIRDSAVGQVEDKRRCNRILFTVQRNNELPHAFLDIKKCGRKAGNYSAELRENPLIKYCARINFVDIQQQGYLMKSR